MFTGILLTTILCLLPYTVALPSTHGLPKTSPHNLSKRLISVLECDPRAKIPNYPNPGPGPMADHDPAKAFVEQVNTFKTMTSLCGSYPQGIGYYCPPAGGALLLQRPLSYLYQFLGPPDSQYLKDACLAHCYCTRIAPDDPDPSSSKPASAQCLAGISESDSESDSDDETNAGGCMETYNDPQDDDGIHCDVTGYLMGNPTNNDCSIAQDGIGEGVDSMTATREFLGVGAESMYNGFPIEQTPFNWSSGSCYIQISMLEGGDHASSQLEDWDYLWGRADAIREKCVRGLGVGGTASAGDVSTGELQSLAVYVIGTKSKNKQLLDMKFGCVADAEGNYSCDDESGPPSKKQKTSSPPTSSSSSSSSDTDNNAPPTGNNRLHHGKQSGACTHYKDCDYRNGYTCHATKKATDGFPVDASFGTFNCMSAASLASAGVAAAKAYVALGGFCRGRCMLDSNGTFNILANDTTAAAAAAAAAAVTGAGVADSKMKAPVLVGPCNCTYVSAACVLSETGIVYEDPSARIQTNVGAANEGLCCDGMTGMWRDRTKGQGGGGGSMCPVVGAGSGKGNASFVGGGGGVLLTPS